MFIKLIDQFQRFHILSYGIMILKYVKFEISKSEKTSKNLI